MTDQLVLAIDQGGHASRAMLVNADGRIVSEGYQEIRTDYPREQWVEHDPEELVLSIVNSVRQALAGVAHRRGSIVSAGLATQRSSIVCWDKNSGTALSPVISWQDRRAGSWIEQFSCYRVDIHEKTGLFLTAHYGFSKIRWCLDNIPQVRQAHQAGTLVIAPLASFIIFRLLEKQPIVVDPANASRTLVWNIHTRNWDEQLLNLFNIPQALLPKCVPSYYPFGHINIAGARIPMRLVTGDQSAALFAFGEPGADTAYINVGTGAFIQRISSQLIQHAPRLLTSVVVQDDNSVVYALEGTVNGAASAITHVEHQLGMDSHTTRKMLPTWLDQASSPPLFLNGVSGLGAPYWVADFQSRFVGEGPDWEKLVAVVESIVFLLMINLQEMHKVVPLPGQIIITGGLAKLDGLCQRMADLSRCTVHRPPECEATAIGTACLLHRPSRGFQQSNGDEFQPQHNPVFQDRFEKWRQAMEAALKVKS
jgi:glycerol kinase